MKRRIFAAVDISDEARREVSDYISNLKTEFPNVKAGWDRPEKLHLTLKFLGDTDEVQLEKLRNYLRKNCRTNFKFEITNFRNRSFSVAAKCACFVAWCSGRC